MAGVMFWTLRSRNFKTEISDLQEMVEKSPIHCGGGTVPPLEKAQSTGDEAKSTAEAAASCADGVASALSSLTIDDLRSGGVYAS